jgi:hypothetical protein
MAVNRELIVKQAEAWLGRKESNLTHRLIIDVYNAHKPLARGYKVKYTDEWCATFASAVAIKCGATDIIPTECGCPQMIELFIKLGSWQEADDYTPSSGDFIFYDWEDNGKGDNKGRANHVGIVQKVSGGYIYVIEGNYSEQVKVRKIKLNGKYIRGFGCPKYTSAKKSNTEIAKEVIKGLWGNGTARKKALKAAGYNPTTIQKRVNELLKK